MDYYGSGYFIEGDQIIYRLDSQTVYKYPITTKIGFVFDGGSEHDVLLKHGEFGDILKYWYTYTQHLVLNNMQDIARTVNYHIVPHRLFSVLNDCINISATKGCRDLYNIIDDLEVINISDPTTIHPRFINKKKSQGWHWFKSTPANTFFVPPDFMSNIKKSYDWVEWTKGSFIPTEILLKD